MLVERKRRMKMMGSKYIWTYSKNVEDKRTEAEFRKGEERARKNKVKFKTIKAQTVKEFLEAGGSIEKVPYNKHSISYLRYNAAKSRAAKLGWDFDLTQKWFQDKIKKGVCEATGIPFGEENTPFVASIDRIDSNRGYTQDNCWVVCWAFNRAKGHNGLDTLMYLAEKIVENKKKILKKVAE